MYTYVCAYIFTSSYRCYELDGARFARGTFMKMSGRDEYIFIEITYVWTFFFFLLEERNIRRPNKCRCWMLLKPLYKLMKIRPMHVQFYGIINIAVSGFIKYYIRTAKRCFSFRI